MATPPDFENKNFLIVDDEEYMSRLITRMLKACNAGTITYADDGLGVLQMAHDSKPPDCIISDFNMKRINGLQLLQGIRVGLSKHLPRHQPFIMVTGHGEQDVVKTAISLDVSGFAIKPVAQTKLAEAIVKALSQPVVLKSADAYKAVRLPKP